MNYLRMLCLLLIAVLLVACPDTKTPVDPEVEVTIDPTSATVSPGGTQTFTAKVKNATNTNVTWSAENGTITGSGVYTAPATEGSDAVTVTSVADTSQKASATVTIIDTDTPGEIVIESFKATPPSIELGSSSTLKWTVRGDKPISLSIDNNVGDVTGKSSIDVSPIATTTYTLTASNNAGEVSESAQVTVGATAGPTTRVSVSSDGGEADARNFGTSISSDGRYIAFHSFAENLVAEDSNTYGDAFVFDRQTKAVELISVSSDSTQGDFASENPIISGNGQFVVFVSRANNLVANDTNNRDDVFVRDLQNKTTERVSISSSGEEGNAGSSGSINPAISDDGRYVAFTSDASNLVDEDTNDEEDVFVHDRQTGKTERVSVDSDGKESKFDSEIPSISGDGRYVAFRSVLGGCDLSTLSIRDRQTNTTTCIENTGTIKKTAMSADGRFIVFSSGMTTLVPNDNNGQTDIFIYDREDSSVKRISVSGDGSEGNGPSQGPDISGDGRYVVFSSYANNLITNDTNDQFDIFIHDRQLGTTERVSIGNGDVQANDSSTIPAVSDDGRFIAFRSLASNLVSNDTNETYDIFVYEHQP